jgi:hypothetical protein
MRSSTVCFDFLTRQFRRLALCRLALSPLVLALAPLCALAATSAQPAQAQLMEPDGLAIPRPVNNGDETGAEANPGSLSIAQLFTSRGETLNWQTDAVTAPATFEPRCSFTGTLVMRGGGCQIDFGWYNANMSSMTPPPDAEIYVLVPGAPGANQDPIFAAGAFSPQAGANGPINANGAAVNLAMFSADSIRANPNYLGGEIGFALKGRAGTDCPQTHFSEQRLNIECTAAGCMAGDHWIAAIIYQSVVTPNAYYLAFEDVAMSPDSFAGPGPFHNDGDFNDFIYFVEGITCDGGGVPCETDLKGVCKPGLMECQPDGSLVCRSQIEPSPEVCDALDNDCDGVVDNGDLCDENFLCVRGNCEPFCVPGEFECQMGFVCVEHVCIEEACAPGDPPVPTVCPEGQVCRGGTCEGVCDGIICPAGQVCEVGKCVDPCAGVTCDEDEICDGGVCVLNCNCRPCADAATVCNTESGRCVAPACETITCTAPTVCQGGTCVDPCTGAMCPGGGMCMAGECMPPPPQVEGVIDPGMLQGGDGLGVGEDPTPVVEGTGGGAGADGAGGNTVVIEDPLEDFGRPAAEPSKGCGCEVPGRTQSQSGMALLAALGVLGLTLQRRSGR